jgi:predicted nucleic acid-binding protein
MKSLVLDCSVSAAWVFDGEAQAGYANAVAKSLSDTQAHVPAVWPGEMANVARQGVKGGRQSREVTLERLALVAALPISIDDAPGDPTQLLNACLDWGLTPYDASYLLLAQRLKAPIATWDKALRKAAAHIGVPVFAPADPIAN